MRVSIDFPNGTWPKLRAHLLDQGPEEQLAVLLAGAARGRGWLRLLVREILPVPASALERQAPTYLEVKPNYSRMVLRRCYEEGLSLIEVHSHPFCREKVSFSGIDLANDELKFRYVASKIPDIHHATLVVGQTDVDARYWDRCRRRPEPVALIRALEAPVLDLVPTSSASEDGDRAQPAGWLHRQVLAFGQEGQQRLGSAKVGVVGCGGTGSALVQMLARLGVQEFVLVDPDVVETSNLNRLVGAREADARRSRPKVRVAGRLVQGINSQARVHELVAGVQQKQSLEALRGGDLLFGCTDNDGSRLILNQLAVQYLLPYLDLGAGLKARGQGQLAAAGGQVRLVQPGAFCLACIDGIDRAQAAVDLLPPLARERRERRGYLQESQMPTPAVLFLNNLVAAHAVSEFVCLWTGYREPAALLHIDLLKPQLLAATAERSPDCVTCGQNGVLGLGDLEAVAGAGGDQPSNSVPAVGRPTQTGTEAPATGKKEPRGQTRTR